MIRNVTATCSQLLFFWNYYSRALTWSEKHFTAQRYANAVFAVTLCPSVHPSVTSRYSIETTWRIERVFGTWRLPSTYPTLSYKEMCVSPKIRILPSGALSQTSDLQNFATASRSRCQQNSSSSPSTVEFVDDTYTTVDESWLFTTNRSNVTL